MSSVDDRLIIGFSLDLCDMIFSHRQFIFDSIYDDLMAFAPPLKIQASEDDTPSSNLNFATGQ